jgi:hypothetical protein
VCAFELFELIPQACKFGRDRFLEADIGSLSDNGFNSYQNFEAQIRDWKITADFDEKYAIPGSQTVALSIKRLY